MQTAAEMHPDLPMTVCRNSRRLNRHERLVIKRLIYTLAGREERRLPELLAEAITICDHKIAPIKQQRKRS